MALLAACSPGVANPRAQDLDALVDAVTTIHPEPFGAISETSWRREVARVRAARMSDDEFLVAVARLANLGDRSGHGGLFPTDQPGLLMWPVGLYEFADGWFVVHAADPSLVGARVERIGGRPIAQVAAAVAPIVPRDNAASLRARLPTYLVVPRFLRGLGLYGPLSVVRDGVPQDVIPEEVPARDYARLAGIDVPQIAPTLPRPSFAPEDDWFWVARRGDAVVVGYERVVEEDQAGHRSQWLEARIEEELATGTPRALVVDVRRNPGGSLGAADRLMALLRQVARRMPVRVLVGRGTYSAAAVVFAQLREDAPRARFYGETSGGGATTFGGPSTRTLPRSGIIVQVAGQPASAPTATAAAIEPDVRVDVTWAAYASGEDPVLAAALR